MKVIIHISLVLGRLIRWQCCGEDLFNTYDISEIISKVNNQHWCQEVFLFQIQAGLNIGLYACPIVILWLYKRDYFTPDGLIYLGKCIASLSLLYFSAYYIRGLGRVFNPEYRLFIDVLAKSARNFNEQNKALLAKYDFDFRAWPVEYSVFNAYVSKAALT